MSFLEIKNASVGFGPPTNRTEVLKDVNLSVEENEFVAVIGFSGSVNPLMAMLCRFARARPRGRCFYEW